ncbi:MAG: polysaccharide deacetylase family protein [Tissierellia bacterium]|nr:polysaccharide deacetylase family protein [Tissierellia bacterium]
MKLIVINKRILYGLIAIVIILIVIAIGIHFYNKSEETFNLDVYYKGNIDDKIIAFACNVDWGNEYIKPMLNILSEHNIKITFFVTGRWAKENQELLRTIYNEGHEIGNHGYEHLEYDKLNYEKNREQILVAHDIIKKTLGIESRFFAPPAGAYNENTIKAAKDLEYEVVMWSIDTIDWREDSTKDIIIKRITDRLHNSAIILMHPTEETVNALPEIISYIFNKGYKIGKIGDVIK